MNEQQLRQLFSNILYGTLCLPALMGTGCGTGSSSPVTIVPPAQLPILTQAPRLPGPLCSTTTVFGASGLSPAQPTTFLEAGRFAPLCLLDNMSCATPPTELARRPHVRVGSECSDAKNVGACQSALAQQFRSLCESGSCDVRYVATTMGETTHVLHDAAELAGFLAPIDTVQDAQLVAWMAGFEGFGEEPGVCPSSQNWDTRPVASGYDMTVLHTMAGCLMPGTERCEISISAAGTLMVKSCVNIKPCIVVGRRPAGLSEPERGPGAGPLGDYLANSAQLEAAAVTAFSIMADELRTYGAPPDLIVQAERAQADEVRHAAIMTALAEQYAAIPRQVEVSRSAPRLLADMAAENEVEGCVRETFAALVAHWQSLHAQDHAIADAMRGIAEDETRHAALSWQVAQWAEPLLCPADRIRLCRLRRSAIETLRAECSVTLPDALIQMAGLPTATQAHSLLDQMARALWGNTLLTEPLDERSGAC